MLGFHLLLWLSLSSTLCLGSYYHPNPNDHVDIAQGYQAEGGYADARMLSKRSGTGDGPYYPGQMDDSFHHTNPDTANANPDIDFNPNHFDNGQVMRKREQDYEDVNDMKQKRRLTFTAHEPLRPKREGIYPISARQRAAPSMGLIRPKRQNTLTFPGVESPGMARFTRSSPPPSPESNEFFGHQNKLNLIKRGSPNSRTEDPAEWGEGPGGRNVIKPGSTSTFPKSNQKYKRDTVYGNLPQQPHQPSQIRPMFDLKEVQRQKEDHYANLVGAGAFRNQLPELSQSDEFKGPYPYYEYSPEFGSEEYRG